MCTDTKIMISVCRGTLLHLILLSLMLFGTVSTAHAQNMGTLRGTVTDSDSGQPLPGTNITVLGSLTGTTSDANGRYSLSLLPGSYEIQASFVGFKPVTVSVKIAAGATVTRDFVMVPDLVGAGEVVVLGTRRSGRTVIDSPVPVDVLTSEEIKSTGMVETTQLLQQLIPSYNAPQASITDGSDHIRPATLRGLGPDQVLVLINGKRVHTSALVHVNGSVGRGSTGVDMNAIPTSIIQRIEVLRDGAAAQYGSDAIAGVINIVLKEHTGFDAAVNVGQYASSPDRGYQESEGNRPGEDASTYNWDGSGVIGSPTSPNYSDGKTANLYMGYGVPLPKGSLYVAGTYTHQDFINRAGLDPRQQYYDGFLSNPSFKPQYTEETFPRLNHRYGNGEFDEASIFANATFPIDEQGTQVYGFGGLYYRDGESGCFYRRSLDNRTNRRLYPDGFLPKINGRVTDFNAAGGIKGSRSGWAYDLSQTVGGNALNFHMVDTHNASLTNGQRSFDSGTLNFSQATSNLDLFRSAEIGTASPLSIAIGGEFRYDHYWINDGEPNSYINGGTPVLDGPNSGAATAAGAQCFAGFQPRSAQNQNRTNIGVYVDLENNLTSALLVSVAGRFENYSDFGTTVTGKFATRLELTPQVALRGAVSSGFRAPSLAQEWFTSIATNFIDGVPFEVGTFPVKSEVAQALGAKELDPETSVNVSGGVTFNVNNLSLTADAYLIELNNRITFTENFTSSDVASFLKDKGINANGGRFFTNALDTRTKGIDIIARYAARVGPGTGRFTAAMNFANTDITNKNADGQIPSNSILTSLGEPQFIGRSRQGDFEDAQPKNKVNLQVNYDVKKWKFMVRTNQYGEVTSRSNDETRDQTFSAKWITDAEISYAVRQGVSLAFGSNNLFDVYPDKQFKRNSFNGVFPYNGFSPFGFFGRYLYSRINISI